MIKIRRRQEMPALNTTSTADISFMLLVFFLVTTSLDYDKGLTRQLAPMPDEEQSEELEVEKEDLLSISLDADDRLTCEGEEVTEEALAERVAAFIAAKPQEHVIAVSTDKNTSYDAYFGMQDAIVSAYKGLRNKLARERYGKAYRDCDKQQREDVAACYPQRISEGGAK